MSLFSIFVKPDDVIRAIARRYFKQELNHVITRTAHGVPINTYERQVADYIQYAEPRIVGFLNGIPKDRDRERVAFDFADFVLKYYRGRCPTRLLITTAMVGTVLNTLAYEDRLGITGRLLKEWADAYMQGKEHMHDMINMVEVFLLYLAERGSSSI